MEDKAYMMGAFIFKSIDAIDIYYNKHKHLIFGNVLRNNTYPLSVSSERVIQAVEIVKYAKKISTHIAHGSTGAGNDQVRFDSIFQIMAPEIEILTQLETTHFLEKRKLII